MMVKRLSIVVMSCILLSVIVLSAWGQGKPKTANDAEIVFSELRDGNRDIYIINPDGTNERRLTTHDAEDRQPVWSPDRLSILFSSNRPNPNAAADSPGARGDNFGIWVMDADGGNQRPVLADGEYYEFASWSPDGAQIIYATSRHGTLDLYVYNLSTQQAQRLTQDAGDETEPAWSPDGASIAYTWRTDDGSSIALYDTRAGQTRRLYGLPGSEIISPAWSTDSTRLAFVSQLFDEGGFYSEINIFTVAEAGEPDAVTVINGQFANSISWSPDDTSLAYGLFQPRGAVRSIQLVNVDGQNLRQLPTDAGDEPNWSLPQGARVLAVQVGESGGQGAAPTRPATQTVQCPGTQPSRLVVGDTARVTLDGDSNRFRAGPGTNRNQIGTIPRGGVFEVIGGPECANGYAWYQVRYNGRDGWTAEGDSRTYWTERYTGTAQAGGGGSSGGSTGGRLLTGGRGLTNGAALNAGEFQVEYYCNRQGYGISNDNTNWYCTSGSRRVQTLGQADFNRICRETYSNASAYAVRDGNNRVAAYNWRCYG